jgi:hypothetical protein
MGTTRKGKAKTRRVQNRTPTPYPAIHQYMNVTQTWKNGEGRRNTVLIRNGKGTKRVERLGPRGEVLDVQNRPLTGPERNQILQGQFIPGLWRNCRLC